MDDSDEQAWCDDGRATIIAYLAEQNIDHGEVGEWPAWHIHPHIAVWAIESAINPGWVGWWAVSGDVPTDYTSCSADRHPRAGLRDIAERWRKAAPLMAEGETLSDWSVGPAEMRRELAPLLAARADFMLSCADDDALWEE